MQIDNVIPANLLDRVNAVDDLVTEFAQACNPLEKTFHILVDARTFARFCECHILASRLVKFATIDVPLDPDEQPDYRANREIVTSHQAFDTMKKDALQRRSFSNIVIEYSTEYDSAYPLKIIGGQHRFEAIKLALEAGVDENHGVKVYFGLTAEQRLDVQLISNTVIAVSTDLYDRMQETVKGPELRNWCQRVGLLGEGQDFSDKRQRGLPITVGAARIFIVNYFRGRSIDPKVFDETDTTPLVFKSGQVNTEWEKLRYEDSSLWQNAGLEEAGRRFSSLVAAQRAAFSKGGSGKSGRNVDFEEKALNYAIIASWAFVAGLLHNNNIRLSRHFDLDRVAGKDPLNAVALAKGRHKTDPENYRGLGYRTDPKERGRLVELFYLQTEKGEGINPKIIDLAIKKYHAKQATLEVKIAESAEEIL